MYHRLNLIIKNYFALICPDCGTKLNANEFLTSTYFSGQGHFMHFSTASGDSGKHAVLKTRWFYPKPGPQCMQFFLFNSGGANDLLQVGMQEYNNAEIIFGKSISGKKLFNLNYTK